MTTFRDAIAAFTDCDPLGEDPPCCAWCTAGAILAMPEMEAVRKALRDLSHVENLLGYALPESVIAWVLGEDQ